MASQATWDSLREWGLKVAGSLVMGKLPSGSGPSLSSDFKVASGEKCRPIAPEDACSQGHPPAAGGMGRGGLGIHFHEVPRFPDLVNISHVWVHILSGRQSMALWNSPRSWEHPTLKHVSLLGKGEKKRGERAARVLSWVTRNIQRERGQPGKGLAMERSKETKRWPPSPLLPHNHLGRGGR